MSEKDSSQGCLVAIGAILLVVATVVAIAAMITAGAGCGFAYAVGLWFRALWNRLSFRRANASS